MQRCLLGVKIRKLTLEIEERMTMMSMSKEILKRKRMLRMEVKKPEKTS